MAGNRTRKRKEVPVMSATQGNLFMTSEGESVFYSLIGDVRKQWTAMPTMIGEERMLLTAQKAREEIIIWMI